MLTVFRLVAMRKAFEKYANAMLADWNQVFVRRMMWADMEARVKNLFKEIESSPQADWFGGIRIHGGLHPDAKEIHVTDRLNQLQVTCMTRLLGIRSVKNAEETREIDGVERKVHVVKRTTHMETEACMWFSQSPSGGVTVFMSPYKSDLVSMNEKEIIIGMFKDPNRLTERNIRKLFSRFLKYRQISSALHHHTFLDYGWRLWLTYLDVRHRRVWKTVVAINVLIIFGAAFFTVLGYFLKP